MSNQILISSGAKLRDLDDVIIGTDGVLSSLGFNVANGVPKLDENGKILVSQLPNSVMEFKGVWDAATNTPTLANGTGNAGDVYLCNVAGTVNFGTGPITFAVGDYAVYTGTVWARSSGATGTVTSVAVSKDGDALAITGSPITTSGTINIGFAGTNLQYINGAGNLVTFPDLTVYVPTSRTLTINDVTYDLSANRTWTIDSMIYPEEGIAVSTGTAWGDSIVDNSSNWNTAYNNSIVSAEVTGTTTKTLTLDQQDGGTITASWTDYDTAPVTSVFGRTGAVVAVSGDYTTAQVTESGNLYFTDARARAAISLTTLGTSGAATYNNTTGVLNIPNYTTDLTGYVPYTGATTNVNLGVHSLSAYDLIINHTSGSGVAASITKGGNGEALTVVKSSGSGNAASITGGVTLLSELNLTTDLADAYIASADNWNTAYTNRITSATSPLSITSNVISIATANTTTTGALSSTDWNTFNGKQNALTNPITGTGTANKVAKFSGSTTLVDSSIGDTAGVALSIIKDAAAITSALVSISPTTGTNASILNLDNAGSGSFFIGRQNSAGASVLLGSLGAYDAVIGNTGSQTLHLVTTATSRLAVFGDGNIGINTTTNAGYKLDVNGTGRFYLSTYQRIETFFSSPYTSGFKFSDLNGQIIFNAGTDNMSILSSAAGGNITLGTAGSTKLTINNNNTIAIGGITPTATSLASIQSAYGVLSGLIETNISSNSYYNSGWKYYSAAPIALLNLDTAGNFGFYTAIAGSANGSISLGIPKVTITNAGALLINTTSGITGGGALQVNGNVNINGVFQINGVTIGGGGGSGVTGSGTSGYMTKWTGSSTLGNSIIQDNGSTITVIAGIEIAARFATSGDGTIIIGGTAAQGASSGEMYVTYQNATTNTNAWMVGMDDGEDFRWAYGAQGEITDANTLMKMSQTGYLGLGTLTPLEKLHVQDGNVSIRIQSTSAGQNANLKILTTARSWSLGPNQYMSDSSFEFVDSTAGANRMTLFTSGNFSINNGSNPTDNGYKLQINGSASFAYGFLSVYRGSSSPNDILVGNDGSRFYIGGNAYVAGSVTASGGFFDTSDARLKTLVEDNYLLSSIANVKAKLYIKNGRTELGYYAQDLQVILPYAVNEGSDGFLSLSYAQVHTAKIAVIEDKVTILENEVAELKSKLQKYEA